MHSDSAGALDWLDQRLDALDRNLMGLLPRTERAAFVAKIESRLREQYAANPAALESLAKALPAAPEDSLAASPPPSPRRVEPPPRKRSRLALTAGVLSIVACGLLLLVPITYTFVVSFSDALGEFPSIALFSVHILAVTGASAIALPLGLTALIRVSRSKSQKRGLGWAITALAASPLPFCLGLLATLFIVLPTGAALLSDANAGGPVYQVSAVPPPMDLPPPMQPLSPPAAPVGSAPYSLTPSLPSSNYAAPDAQCGPDGCTLPPTFMKLPAASQVPKYDPAPPAYEPAVPANPPAAAASQAPPPPPETQTPPATQFRDDPIEPAETDLP